MDVKLGRPTTFYLCEKMDNGAYCPHLVYRDGFCFVHCQKLNENQNEKQTPNLNNKILCNLVKYDDELCGGVVYIDNLCYIHFTEKNRISEIIKKDPNKYKTDISQSLADSSPKWIWSIDHYGQFNINGIELIRCDCPACTYRDEIHDTQFSNGHCQYCLCNKCVCQARVANNQVPDKYPRLPYWDNACRGSCDSCKVIYENNSCVIL